MSRFHGFMNKNPPFVGSEPAGAALAWVGSGDDGDHKEPPSHDAHYR